MKKKCEHEWRYADKFVNLRGRAVYAFFCPKCHAVHEVESAFEEFQPRGGVRFDG